MSLNFSVAQVEDLLKDVNKGDVSQKDDPNAFASMFQGAAFDLVEPTSAASENMAPDPDGFEYGGMPFSGCSFRQGPEGPSSAALVDLGMSEAPPPFEIIEEL